MRGKGGITYFPTGNSVDRADQFALGEEIVVNVFELDPVFIGVVVERAHPCTAASLLPRDAPLTDVMGIISVMTNELVICTRNDW